MEEGVSAFLSIAREPGTPACRQAGVHDDLERAISSAIL
jgi:hypothetical protein